MWTANAGPRKQGTDPWSIASTVMGVLVAGIVGLAALATPAQAQDPAEPNLSPVETRDFEGLAEGPYDRLVIRNVKVIPGHGGPPTGPHDILIEGNVITAIEDYDAVALERARQAGEEIERLDGDRVIEGDGMYVMPGMFDLHHHWRGEEIPLEYTHYLKLAHGVTTAGPTGGDRGQEFAMERAEESANNEILAPRLIPTVQWSVGRIQGLGVDVTAEELDDPEEAPRIAQEIVDAGGRSVGVNAATWNPELFEAAARGLDEAGAFTTVHIPPSNTAMVHALEAARRGVTFIKHHYGLAESAVPRGVQDFPRDYDYDNEQHRFREAGRVWEEVGWNPESRERLLQDVADSLVHYGTHLMPTMVVYEANRDILRAQSLPWHEKYTHRQLLEWSVPDPAWHGSFHWDWTHDDEETWRYAFDLWGQLIYEVNKRGGLVAVGTDDNYIWATPGFSSVRELQLIRESGMHSLEVLAAATYNSAKLAGEPNLGLVREGYLADLVIVDGNPAENFRHLYSFGAIRMNEDEEMYRSRGIVHTVKDGIVVENDRVMEAVADMVEESWEGSEPNITEIPFGVNRP